MARITLTFWDVDDNNESFANTIVLEDAELMYDEKYICVESPLQNLMISESRFIKLTTVRCD